MPKDPKKNVDRFKVRGGDLNEYDFTQNQEQLAENQKHHQKLADQSEKSLKDDQTRNKEKDG